MPIVLPIPGTPRSWTRSQQLSSPYFYRTLPDAPTTVTGADTWKRPPLVTDLTIPEAALAKGIPLIRQGSSKAPTAPPTGVDTTSTATGIEKAATMAAKAPDAPKGWEGHAGSLKVTVLVLSFIVIAVATWLIAENVNSGSDGAMGKLAADPETTSPAEGLTIISVFFVAALAIERLLEPLTQLFPAKAKQTANRTALIDEWATAVADAKAAVEQWWLAYTTASTKRAEVTSTTTTSERATIETAAADLDKAADELAKKAGAAVITANTLGDKAAESAETLTAIEAARTAGFWCLATILGMLCSALMNLYLLHVVGISTGYRWIEILSTGLILGAGTVPLHGLVKQIEKKKDDSDKEADTTA